MRTKGAPLGAMVPGGAATAGAGESHESTILLGWTCDDHLSGARLPAGSEATVVCYRGSVQAAAQEDVWRGW